MTDSFDRPDPNTRLWRYVSFGKLVAMLQHDGVFAPRVSCFEDPFEGSYPKQMQNETVRQRALKWEHQHLTAEGGSFEGGRLDPGWDPGDAGQWINTGLGLVDEVRLAPSTPDWMDEAIRGVVDEI